MKQKNTVYAIHAPPPRPTFLAATFLAGGLSICYLVALALARIAF